MKYKYYRGLLIVYGLRPLALQLVRFNNIDYMLPIGEDDEIGNKTDLDKIHVIKKL